MVTVHSFMIFSLHSMEPFLNEAWMNKSSEFSYLGRAPWLFDAIFGRSTPIDLGRALPLPVLT